MKLNDLLRSLGFNVDKEFNIPELPTTQVSTPDTPTESIEQTSQNGTTQQAEGQIAVGSAVEQDKIKQLEQQLKEARQANMLLLNRTAKSEDISENSIEEAIYTFCCPERQVISGKTAD